MKDDKVSLARKRVELIESLNGPLSTADRARLQGDLSITNAKIKALNTMEAARLKVVADRRKVAGLIEAQANTARARANAGSMTSCRTTTTLGKRPRSTVGSTPCSYATTSSSRATTLHDPIRDRWEENDTKGGARLYCTSSPLTHGAENGRWALQIFARVKTKRGGEGKHIAVNIASMASADLLWLRGTIDTALRSTRKSR